jgi:hypothetical protein
MRVMLTVEVVVAVDDKAFSQSMFPQRHSPLGLRLTIGGVDLWEKRFRET